MGERGREVEVGFVMKYLRYWTAEHPDVVSFRWHRNPPAANYTFLISCIVGYLVVINFLRTLMKGRKAPVSLGLIPPLHNLVLALGSLMMFIGCLEATLVEIEESRWMWGNKGARQWILCFPIGTRPAGRVFFWSYVYYLSKYYELLDTVILVLKKKDLTVLHVFHHVTVICMSFFWLEFVMSIQILGLLTNTGVHVIMYTYYFLCSINHPPAWKKLLTNIQILQFVFSFVASVGTLRFHFNGDGCCGMGAWTFNAAFNTSLLILFMNFYRKQYKAKRVDRVKPTECDKLE